MNYTDVPLKPCRYGLSFETASVAGLFGDRRSQGDVIRTAYPTVDFHFLKQSHSLRVVEIDGNNQGTPDADAHWTKKSATALCIYTADCTPILLTSAFSPVVAAVHAGWRGVAGNIVSQLFTQLVAAGFSPASFYAWIGPHIQAASFEVDLDVALQLEQSWLALASSKDQPSPLLPHANLAKRYVDLEKIVRAQLVEVGLRSGNITSSSDDTFLSPDYYSFRRDRCAERQISFIYKR